MIVSPMPRDAVSQAASLRRKFLLPSKRPETQVSCEPLVQESNTALHEPFAFQSLLDGDELYGALVDPLPAPEPPCSSIPCVNGGSYMPEGVAYLCLLSVSALLMLQIGSNLFFRA